MRELIPLGPERGILGPSRRRRVCLRRRRMPVFDGPSVAHILAEPSSAWTQPGRHPARRTRPRASRSSLDFEGLAGARTGTACRSAGLESDWLARDTCARIAVKAPDSSPKSGDGTFRRRSWDHPRRQRFDRFRAAGRPCRMFVQEVLRRLRRPAPGNDAQNLGRLAPRGKRPRELVGSDDARSAWLAQRTGSW